MASIEVTVFWDESFALVEAVNTCEMLVNLYQIVWHSIQEDSVLHVMNELQHNSLRVILISSVHLYIRFPRCNFP